MHLLRPMKSKRLRRWLLGISLSAACGGWCAADAADTIVAVSDQPGRQKIAPEVIAVGDTILLRAESGRKIKRVDPNRLGIVRIEPQKEDPTVVYAIGLRIGEVRITITDEGDVQSKVTVKVTRRLSDVEQALQRQFPRANIKLDGADGNIIVTGSVDSTEEVDPIMTFVEGSAGGRVINAIRVVGVMQVQLEVCLARVSRTEFRRMGFNFFHSDDDNSWFGSQPTNLLTERPQVLGPNTSGTAETLLAPFGTFGGTVGPETNLFFGIFDDNSGLFGFLQALRSEGVAKVLANPTLVALNGKQATFRSGGQLNVITSGLTTGGLEKIPFGTQLTFIPTILGEGKIRLSVNPEVSATSEPIVNGVPSLIQQTVETTVEMESGQTLVLAGLLQNRVQATTTKTPILGDLPFLGAMFRSVSYNEEEEELIVIVTPRLVDPLDCSQRTTKLPGQETRSPTDFELFLEGILEAPRGPREICPDGVYRPAHWWIDGGEGCSTAAPACRSVHGYVGPTPVRIAPVAGEELPRPVPAQPTPVIETGESGAGYLEE